MCFHCKPLCSGQEEKSSPGYVICMKTLEFSLILLDMFVYPVVFLMFDESELSQRFAWGTRLLSNARFGRTANFFHHLGRKLPS